MPFEGIEKQGLSSDQAAAKLAQVGPNILPDKKPPSSILVLLAQFRSPLVYVLLAATVVTVVLRHYSDAVVIGLAVFINTILGFVQEKRAGDALYALKRMLQPQAKVLRNGEQQTIEANQIVPDDIVVLNQGDKVPADGKMVHANRLFVSEALLTGESLPIAKQHQDEVFMGTIVTSGRGFMKVTVTGAKTKIGSIAASIQETSSETPLKRQLKHFSKILAVVVLCLTALVFLLGAASGLGLLDIFTISVALAVSAIPEGLLVSLTVVLAIGMQRILARRGLVRNLVSAETLGAVTTICIDKTGTLTEGVMRVVEVVGNKDGLIEQAVLANDLDDPIVIAAFDWAKDQLDPQSLSNKHQRLDSVPFSSKERYFASLVTWNKSQNMLFVNGAAEFLLEWSTLSVTQKEKTHSLIESYTNQGMRVIGMARKKVENSHKSIADRDVKADLEWVGFFVFSDPVRESVAANLDKVRQAGIKVIVITGDYPKTAMAVMRGLAMLVDETTTITGDKLANLDASELAHLLQKNKINLFARTSPDQKLKIVHALKANGEIVAMMGDGVNDAPALKNADIGVAVGDATDVAKESSDLVLLDANFSTLIAAIEEGRSIFENIRKIVLYLMSNAFSEITLVIGSILVGIPLPISASQILWVNLVTDGMPDLSLTVDPRRAGIMREPPRNVREDIVTRWMYALLATTSLLSGVAILLVFVFVLKTTNDLSLARSVAFASLGFNSLFIVFSARNLLKPIGTAKLFSNRWLILAVIVGAALQLAPFAIPGLRAFFSLSLIPIYLWLVIVIVSIGLVIVIELAKFVIRRSEGVVKNARYRT